MLKIALWKLNGLQINMMMQDYDFLRKSSTGSELNWWTVDGRAGVRYTPTCQLLYFTIF